MTRLYNDPTRFKEELIDGFVAAYGRYVTRIPNASGAVSYTHLTLPTSDLV